MKTLIALLLVSLAQNTVAETVTLDFGAFLSQTGGSATQYNEDGYLLSAPSRLLIAKPNTTGSIQMIGINRSGDIATLTRQDAHAFNLVSIDIARSFFVGTFSDINPFDLIFNGILAGGGTVNQTLTYTGGSSGVGIQNFVFSNFNNLTQVSWTQGLVNPHRFDNIVLEKSAVSNVSAVPVPAAAWLFSSSLLGFAALRRKLNA